MSLRVSERYLWALSVMHIIRSLGRYLTNELVAGRCITERVKRLADNEIELGMMIPTIESRGSKIPMTKGTTYVVPFVIGMLLARDSIVGIQYLVQSRYRQISLLVL